MTGTLKLPYTKLKKKISSYQFDHILLGVALILILFGIYLQFNIATSLGETLPMRMFINQVRSLVVAALVFIIIFSIPNLSKLLYNLSPILLIGTICLLVYVLFYGVTAQGSTRWMRLPFFSFQPSALAHPILIIFFAKYLDKKQHIIKKTGFVRFIKDFQILIFVTITILVLIFFQRHLSTLIVLSLTILGLLFVTGFKKSLLLITLLLIAVSVYFTVFKGEDYRSGRMDIFANYSLFHRALGVERQEITADAFQVRESLIAISQGGFFGTGVQGGRANMRFLPDVNSDYIFAMIGEQFGFIGGAIVILLFCVLLFRTLMISNKSDSFFKKVLVAGFGLNIFISAMVNIGVSLSALPSTGLPLPYISYGGSALLVNVAMLAIILNISMMKRKKV
jgi:cell division protein FtsW (lipid II flippase)